MATRSCFPLKTSTGHTPNEHVARIDGCHHRCVMAWHESNPPACSPWTVCLFIPLQRSLFFSEYTPLQLVEEPGFEVNRCTVWNSAVGRYQHPLPSWPLPTNRLHRLHRSSALGRSVSAARPFSSVQVTMTLRIDCLRTSELAPTTNATTLPNCTTSYVPSKNPRSCGIATTQHPSRPGLTSRTTQLGTWIDQTYGNGALNNGCVHGRNNRVRTTPVTLKTFWIFFGASTRPCEMLTKSNTF